MYKQTFRFTRSSITWTRFTRKSYAVFASLGREIRIGVLSVATLTFATPDCAIAHMSMNTNDIAEATTDDDGDQPSPLDIGLLEEGDLLFNIESNPSELSQAIVQSTARSTNISHVAIVCKRNGKTFALEASSRHGVWLCPIDTFFSHATHDALGNPLILIGRLHDRSNVKASVQKAMTYLGRPYDHLYMPDDSAIYCSELVQLSYSQTDGTPIFPQQPMSFHDSDGAILPYWTAYYARHGLAVPEGEPGTNPNDISRSPAIRLYRAQKLSGKTDKDLLSGKADKDVRLGDAIVSASRIPVPTNKAARLVQVLSNDDIAASAAESVNDLLKLVAGVDVRQRGGFGIQTDIGILGGNEDQLTLLLNGVNITNPQTGHHTFNLPLTPDDIESIEVIEGGASRVYGASAFSGVVNIITKKHNQEPRTSQPPKPNISLSAGSYGTLTASANTTFGGNFLSASYSQSDGAAANSDFKRATAFWAQTYEGDRIDIRLQTGYSDTRYGANTFYGTGSNSQYEEGNHFTASVEAETKARIHLRPQFYYNRATDHYVWLRRNPSAYENHHITTTSGANINAWTSWALGKTAIGLELRREAILSTRLGRPIEANRLNRYPGYAYQDDRTQLGIYAEHAIFLSRWSIALGMLASRHTNIHGLRLYPGIDCSYTPATGLRLFASFNQSLRTPTFTDLYYNGPGLEGNSALKPERSTDYSLGASFTAPCLTATAKTFYRHGTDMIDWVRRNHDAVWTTANSDIDNYGAEATATIRLHRLCKSLSLSYCYNHQRRIDRETAATYANQLVYLRHKFVASLTHTILPHLDATWQMQWKSRTGWFDNATTARRQPYGNFATLDLKLQCHLPTSTLYLQANNLTAHRYYDIANVQQPGAWFLAGLKISN